MSASPNLPIRLGCAGWSLRREFWPEFPETGSHLERYAGRFDAVEINSSFYRPHKPETYRRWAASVPDDFRFAVKLPRLITHERRLLDSEDALDAFLAEAGGLGEKLGCLLVQLPPSLGLNPASAEAFLSALRRRFDGAVALEPRHASWFAPGVEALLLEHRIARVAADPRPVPAAGEPAGHADTVYYRLHGSPEMYYSSYDADFLADLAGRLGELRRRSTVWCVFDNTTIGAATANALDLARRLEVSSGVVDPA